MKRYIENPFRLPVLLAGFVLMLAGRVTAQTFTTLHSFTALVSETNSDGANPWAGLILSGNILYGTALGGGSSGWGAVFAINIKGTGFTTLHSFTAASGSNYTNSDGANIRGGLILSGNTLYGTASGGGSWGNGTVFAINTNGTGFTNLYSFTALDVATDTTNSDGANPQAGLILSGNTLYGTAQWGGTSGNGTVFAISTNGTGFTNLYSFTALDVATDTTNSDGANPYAGLILSGNTLYGTAQYGGTWGNGTVFAINTNGNGFTNLHSFTATSGSNYTNSDGANPQAGLTLSGNTLYGTAQWGGTSGNGTVFAISTNGTGFTNLYSFTALDVATDTTNSDGAFPQAGLILSGNTLYGTARSGGISGNGTVFAINTNGNGFTNLYSFTAFEGATDTTNSDGAFPQAGLILSGNTLYGTAQWGGTSGWGALFSLSFPSPQLTIILSSPSVNLTWPSGVAGFSYSGFRLQSTTNLGSPAVWTSVSPGPVVIGGQNLVINTISGRQQFFRLSQ